MSTIEIVLSDELRAAADEQVAKGRFASASEYVRSLIEADQRRIKVEAILVERMEQSEEVPMDGKDFENMRDAFKRGRA